MVKYYRLKKQNKTKQKQDCDVFLYCVAILLTRSYYSHIGTPLEIPHTDVIELGKLEIWLTVNDW